LGLADVSLKQWFSNKMRFADMFNAVIFDGEQVVKPDELVELNCESDIIISVKDELSATEDESKDDTEDKKKDKAIQRYHDLVMRWRDEIDLSMVLTLENQDAVSYAMPVREMIYDGLAYADQMRNVWNELSDEEKRVLETAEFFSRFRMQDKICPVISIVFYYGTDEWNGPVELYDMFGIKDKSVLDILHRCVPNYRINLVEACKIGNAEKFKSDLQVMLGMLQYRSNKKGLLRYTDEHRDYFSHMDFESQKAMAVFLNTKKLLKKVVEKGRSEGDMCQALQELFDDGVQVGIERGIEQGIERGVEREKKNTVIKMLIKGFDTKLISELSGLTHEQIEKFRIESM